MKVYLFGYLLIYLLANCHNTGYQTKSFDTNESLKKAVKKQYPIESTVKNDSSKFDSLKIGMKFHNYNAFKDYELIEKEPYEFMATTSDIKSTELMIYHKNNYNYVVLVVADGLVDKVDYDWEKLEKEVKDIIIYASHLELCWYLRRELGNNVFDTNGFGIGKKYQEQGERTIYLKEKLFIVDYDEGKINELKDSNPTFECTDGH